MLPLARPVSAGDSGISVPISPSAGPSRTSTRVRPSRRWASRSKSASALLSWLSAPGDALALATMKLSVEAICGLRASGATARCAPSASPASSAARAAAGALQQRVEAAAAAAVELDADSCRARRSRPPVPAAQRSAPAPAAPSDVEDRLVDRVGRESEDQRQGERGPEVVLGQRPSSRARRLRQSIRVRSSRAAPRPSSTSTVSTERMTAHGEVPVWRVAVAGRQLGTAVGCGRAVDERARARRDGVDRRDQQPGHVAAVLAGRARRALVVAARA